MSQNFKCSRGTAVLDYPDFQIFQDCRFADYPDSRIFQACRSVPIQIIRYPDYSIASKKVQRQPVGRHCVMALTRGAVRDELW